MKAAPGGGRGLWMKPANVSSLIRAVRPLADQSPMVVRALKAAHAQAARVHHDIARYFPAAIRPQPRQLTVSITSYCNLRCRGCLYGRGFKHGTQLSADMLKSALADAREAGIENVRFYGGEPLLHRDLPAFVAETRRLGMRPYVTSNGILLGMKITELHAAGLHTITIGYYGSAAHYETYSQRREQRTKLEESLAAARRAAGDSLELQLNFVLLKSCTSPEALDEAWQLAQRFGMYLHFDLASYSVPFFNNDESLGLQFEERDRPMLERVVEKILDLKAANPQRILHGEAFIRSIPDWLIKKADMRVPCDAYEMVWVGPDGTVQLCDTAFTLGNLHETSLSQMLFSASHVEACRNAFQLKCPNCNCRPDSRILRHRKAWRDYR